MPTLARFTLNRGVETLTPEQLQKLIIESHPEGISSDWYNRLEALCRNNDYEGVINMVVEYLQGEETIHSVNQLEPEFIAYYRTIENGIKCEADKEGLLKSCDLRKLKQFFPSEEGKEKEGLNKNYIQLSNTALCLSIVGKLGHKENINYTLLLKSFHLLDLLIRKKKEVTLGEVRSFLDRTLSLPYCFFRLNSCSKKLEEVKFERPFGYLNLGNIRTKSIGDGKDGIDIIENPNDPRDPKDPTTPQDPCDCSGDCEGKCQPQNPCCAEIKPFITDLMVVKEELQCYEAKHLAYIETIMLGETRKREHRHLERSEEYSERETTTTKSEEKDHQVAQRFSLQTEMQKTIESDISIDAGVTANTWGPGYDVTGTLDVATQNSKSESQRVAREQALDITERTVRKIQETVRELNTQKRIVETEEINNHKFKNSVDDGGQKHINGMYQFVNMISKGQVMNYGKRLMFEFVLPEPLELYKRLQSHEVNKFDLEKPEKPTYNSEDISASLGAFNYIELLKEQDADFDKIELLPSSKVFVGEQFIHQDNKEYAFPHPKIAPKPITIPEGYKAVRAHFTGGVSWSKYSQDEFGQGGAHWCTLIAGEAFINQGRTGNPESFSVSFALNNEELTVPCGINTRGAVGFSIVAEIECELTDRAKSEWKLGIFKQIMAAYQVKLNNYNAAKARYDAEKERKQKFGRNPFLNREIERTELKRMAISYISCQFYDQFTAMKRKVEPCGYPQMDLEAAQRNGKFIQFFEQLFDWNLMTYLFYPYFWGQKCSWAEKIQQDSGDALFDKALMAGAARVQVPVKLGHEPLAIHWITFGEIWNGNDDIPTPNSPYYISMAQEIKEQKGIFYADREGSIDVVVGSTTLNLKVTDQYWDYGTSTVDQLKIDNDLNREIIIDCEVYKILSILEDLSVSDHTQWIIEIDKPYEGEIDLTDYPWSTGAIFVGAPFKIEVPTSLVYLKNKILNGNYVTEDCLPCFPQEKCQ